MSNYTPTTEQVRDHFSVDRLLGGFVHTIHDADAEFDRWLAEVKAEGWDEGHAAGFCEGRNACTPECAPHENPYRAAQIAGTTEAGDDRG